VLFEGRLDGRPHQVGYKRISRCVGRALPLVHKVDFVGQKGSQRTATAHVRGCKELPLKAIANELRAWVAKEIGPIAKPKDIRFGDNLPKTRSDKIMRRLLRSIAKGEEITQDTSTLENPAILVQLAEKI
jgi:acyl-coenzyme A synthetase/AMP-(fatty) acid ligase